MSAAVVFVIALATMVTWLVNKYVLVPLEITFLQTISFILIIAALVQMVEIILKKISPPLYQALGIYLPLITTNCAVLGVALLVQAKSYNLLQSVVYGTSIAIGFGFAMLLFSGIREQLELVDMPKGMKGIPIALVTAGILSLAFMGFSGLVK
jgi:electron transport complex protein RnfA